ncbi:tRNA-specific adenosine deaminase [Paenibacillus ihbetae]|uniref:tRNA-specific adenosine deaminase n=1 Tax=Paenibacillus ihbetae TaxID=1870820 RepID=A0A1B2E7P7_9BACL|nr:nucleoside deaminase [Paenibacillus ihbetae]ANY76000.1 tRNA-specific adenosine deaminase [Paenibacillus ihbetae]
MTAYSHEYWMKMAVEEAYRNVEQAEGGPFGAIVVKDGKVIGKGRNLVTALNEPTAHAEVQAIREACNHLQSFQLTGCVIYTSCEPCPMCLGAIYWSRPDAVYYASTKKDAANIGFDDHFIYEEIAKPMEQRSIPMMLLQPPDYLLPFQAWSSAERKIEY